MADYVWLYTYFHHHHHHHPNTGGKFASDKKRIRESFCLHLGRSQYMSGDYYYEFGGMSKRRCFSRLGTNRERVMTKRSKVFPAPPRPSNQIFNFLYRPFLIKTWTIALLFQRRDVRFKLGIGPLLHGYSSVCPSVLICSLAKSDIRLIPLCNMKTHHDATWWNNMREVESIMTRRRISDLSVLSLSLWRTTRY